MKYAIIDIGSNSVRLMFHDGVNTLSKHVITTRLAENMSVNNELSAEAIERTVSAVSLFYKKAVEEGCEKIMAFATAAVRKATNKQVFLDAVKLQCGVEVDVVSGELEAKLGCLGALNGADGAIIDVGGASTEINVVKDGEEIYTKSLNEGAVTLTDKFLQDKEKITTYTKEKVHEYGNVPKSNFYAIGGTATSISAMLLELETYDPKRVDGFVVYKSQLKNLLDKLFSLSVEERKKLKGLQPERAKVIASGVSLLFAIMDKFNIQKVTVSEKDNLEGYLKIKG